MPLSANCRHHKFNNSASNDSAEPAIYKESLPCHRRSVVRRQKGGDAADVLQRDAALQRRPPDGVVLQGLWDARAGRDTGAQHGEAEGGRAQVSKERKAGQGSSERQDKERERAQPHNKPWYSSCSERVDRPRRDGVHAYSLGTLRRQV